VEEAVDFENVRGWIGRRESSEDVITLAPAAALAATLDHTTAPSSGQELPPLWHWLYFLPLARQSEIGSDGHPMRGGFLPPVALPRRMWASSRLDFHRPLRMGASVRRDSVIADVQHKHGRSGDLVFVVVRHEIHDGTGCAIVEDQHIVYRSASSAPAASPEAPAESRPAAWKRVVRPDPVLLFRYSALTFNGHRIHYDRPYATAVEGYPGLVVHGPLIATLLVDALLASRPKGRLARFAFRAQRSLFDGTPFTVAGHPSSDGTGWSVWAADAGGNIAMEADAVLLAET
jgi:3-methylfumaryl-CoA hydratase